MKYRSLNYLTIFIFVLMASACTSSPDKKNDSKTTTGSCSHFKLKNIGDGINSSYSKELDFGMTGQNNKRFITLEFYTRHHSAMAENITGNIYEPPFSFGAAFPGIDPHHYGCHTTLPFGKNNIHKSCFISIEFRPNFIRHFMSTFVLNYHVNGNQCTQVVSLRGQGVEVQ